jgi:hypothetical protein
MLKDRILLENYYLPGDFQAHALRPALQSPTLSRTPTNLTPADVYFGRGQTILLERERIKRDTIKQRGSKHHSKAA